MLDFSEEQEMQFIKRKPSLGTRGEPIMLNDLVVESNESMHHKGLSAFEAALAWLSTMIGAALVTYPYAFYRTGFLFGITLNFFVGILTIKACDLYFKIKDLSGNLKSYSEIGFKLQGRKSIFIINMILLHTLSYTRLIFLDTHPHRLHHREASDSEDFEFTHYHFYALHRLCQSLRLSLDQAR